jgi:transcriptional regulator with XRE-family HTH domain
MSKSPLQVASMMRGLYRRVADKLGVDPSYVSRVARGDRRSPKIEEVLDREVSRILTSISRPKTKVKNR